jgi:hypothetical protein
MGPCCSDAVIGKAIVPDVGADVGPAVGEVVGELVGEEVANVVGLAVGERLEKEWAMLLWQGLVPSTWL